MPKSKNNRKSKRQNNRIKNGKKNNYLSSIGYLAKYIKPDEFLSVPKSYDYLADMSVAEIGDLYKQCCENNNREIDSMEGVLSFVFCLKNNFESSISLPNGDYSVSVSTVLGFRSNPSVERRAWIDDLLFNFKAWESWGVSRKNLMNAVMGLNMQNLKDFGSAHLNQYNFAQ